MFHKAFSFGGTLLLSGAAILMVPGLSQAQRGGGGHGGGGHIGGGGGHFGGGGHYGGAGGHFGGGGGHFPGSNGGYRGGMYHGGAHYDGHHYGYGRYRGYYGGYGYYPYYGLYGGGYDPYYYGTSSPTYDSGYSGTYGEVAPDFGYAANPSPSAAGVYQAFYPPSTAAAEPDTPAHLTVRAPADAQLWFNGTPSTGTGTVREFESPPLAAGKYTYDVQAHWTENGHDVFQTQRVEVSAGAQVILSFPVAPKTA
jgi:uncharacterized protein (TIGR03000 family)